MEIVTKMGLESRTDRPMQLVALRSLGPTPAEELRRAHYAAQGRVVEETKMAEQEEELDEDMMADYYAFQASRYRESWEVRFFGLFGSFEDTTNISCMRFTDKKPEQHHGAYLCTTLQIFSLKVAGIKDGLQWPLHVFGTVFLRDSVDHNRITVFNRKRDNCQILTQEVPVLTLTGPTRAVVLVDPVIFEVDLKVKGSAESEDKYLSSLAVPFVGFVTPVDSCQLKRDYTSKISTLEFALGLIVYSVEATVIMRVTYGSWADGHRAKFAARTASIDHEEVILLDSRDNEVPVDDDGWISLSRNVVSVEVKGKLKVVVETLNDEIVVVKEKRFKPKKSGRSGGTFDIGFCHIDITVAWSLVSSV